MQDRDPDLMRRLDGLEPKELGEILRYLLPRAAAAPEQNHFCANHPRPNRDLQPSSGTALN